MPNKKQQKPKASVPQKSKVSAKRPTTVRRSGGILRSVAPALAAVHPTLGTVASTASKFIDTIFGSGAYTVSNNTLVSGTERGVPSFQRNGGAIRLRHSEYVCDVLCGSVFATQISSGINPANPTLFPWLSTVATSFSEYLFHGLVFYYKTTSGTAVSSSSAALGTIVMATNYDPDASPFESKTQMESYNFSTSCVPCADMLHPVECAKGQTPSNRFYVTNSLMPSGLNPNRDARFYYPGVFQLSNVGSQSTSTVGELWVSYDVELDLPVVSTNLSACPPETSVVGVTCDPGVLPFNGVKTSLFSGLKASDATMLTNGARYYAVDDKIYLFDRGVYAITATCTSSGTITGGVTAPQAFGCNTYQTFIGSDGFPTAAVYANAVNSTFTKFYVQVFASWSRILGEPGCPFVKPWGTNGYPTQGAAPRRFTFQIDYLGVPSTINAGNFFLPLEEISQPILERQSAYERDVGEDGVDCAGITPMHNSSSSSIPVVVLPNRQMRRFFQ